MTTTAADQIYTSYIKTTPEKLWAAITNPEFTRQYWGGNVNISDWKKGSAWVHESAADKTLRFVGGEVLESTPPKRLVLSWVDPEDKKEVSRVSFDIEVMHDLVRLVVIHGDFKSGSTMPEKVGGGWPLVLSSLKSYLETGTSIDIAAIKGPCKAA
jgi:uncharacterized protein YndB with AHSA1/START domain